MAENSNTQIDAMLALVGGQIGNINTALPGKIVSYSAGKAVVQPTGQKRFSDGDVLDYPQVHNVPVCWPSFAGGQAGVKGPVKAGDKCLLVFSQSANDGSDDMRQHDLTDAYAVMCDPGNVGASGTNDALTMYYGGASVSISEGGVITITGSVIINGEVVQSGGDMSSNGIVVATHTHGGVQAGGAQTQPPS